MRKINIFCLIDTIDVNIKRKEEKSGGNCLVFVASFLLLKAVELHLLKFFRRASAPSCWPTTTRTSSLPTRLPIPSTFSLLDQFLFRNSPKKYACLKKNWKITNFFKKWRAFLGYPHMGGSSHGSQIFDSSYGRAGIWCKSRIFSSYQGTSWSILRTQPLFYAATGHWSREINHSWFLGPNLFTQILHKQTNFTRCMASLKTFLESDQIVSGWRCKRSSRVMEVCLDERNSNK